MSIKDTAEPRDEGAVLLERDEAVAILTLSRPDALNSLTWTMYQELEAHLTSLKDNPGVRVVIMRGAGKAFAAGTDISQFQNLTAEDGENYEMTMERIIEGLYLFPKPVIAAIHGYAVGAGIVLSSACDLRYATPISRFGAPIARTLGNCLSLKNYRHLVEAFGAMRAKEMLFTARLLSAKEALEAGFLTAILEEDQLYAHTLEIAKQISLLAPLTIWASKEAHRRLAQAEQEVPFNDVLSRVYGSRDFKEGVTAYLEKRKPDWQGR